MMRVESKVCSSLLRYVGMLFVLILGSTSEAFADCSTDSPATCSYVSVNQTVNVTPTAFTASPACKAVSNNTCSSDIMVPTASQAEWSSFLTSSFVTAPGSCLSLSDCSGYSWVASGWGMCSATCGTGTQTQTVTCQKYDTTTNTTTTVANSLCSVSSMPATSQVCTNIPVCTPPPVVAPTVQLTASPTTITSGSASILTWTVDNATSCTASGDSSFTGSVSGSGGTQSVSPTSTTTYSLTCTNSGGSTNATATVTVQAPSTLSTSGNLNIEVTDSIWRTKAPFEYNNFYGLVPDSTCDVGENYHITGVTVNGLPSSQWDVQVGTPDGNVDQIAQVWQALANHVLGMTLQCQKVSVLIGEGQGSGYQTYYGLGFSNVVSVENEGLPIVPVGVIKSDGTPGTISPNARYDATSWSGP